jgi:hypothetical protein
MMDVFVVTMRRYGDREKHSYVLGVYTRSWEAEKYGAVEEVWRGGKYKAEVQAFVLDEEPKAEANHDPIP